MEPFETWCLTKTLHEAEPMCLEKSPFSDGTCSKHQLCSCWYKLGKVQFIHLRSVKECLGLFHSLTVTGYVNTAEQDSAGTRVDKTVNNKVKDKYEARCSDTHETPRVTKVHTMHRVWWVATNKHHPCLLWSLVNVRVRPQRPTVMITEGPHIRRDRHNKRKWRIWW